MAFQTDRQADRPTNHATRFVTIAASTHVDAMGPKKKSRLQKKSKNIDVVTVAEDAQNDGRGS